MDRVIQKSKWPRKKIMMIIGIVAIITLILASYFLTSGKSRLNVDTERITITEITKGAFQENIPVNGIVLPVTTIYLDAVEGGRTVPFTGIVRPPTTASKQMFLLAKTILFTGISNPE